MKHGEIVAHPAHKQPSKLEKEQMFEKQFALVVKTKVSRVSGNNWTD